MDAVVNRGSSSAPLHTLGHQSAALAITRGRAARHQANNTFIADYSVGAHLKSFSSSFGRHASNRDPILAEQQLLDDVLLPALGGGRIARSEQLKQRELAKSKFQSSKRRATVNVAKLLTNQIAAATSLEQLHDVVAAHGNYLDHIHVAKLLSRMSQLSVAVMQQQQQPADAAAASQQQQQHSGQDVSFQEQQQKQVQQLLYTQLTAMMVQRLRHATGQSLVAATAALGRMSSLKQPGSSSSLTGPNAQQLQQFALKALELAPELSISQLAVVLWGVAKAGYKPGDSSRSSSIWLHQMLAAVLQQYNKAQERQQRLPSHKQQQQQQQIEPGQQAATPVDDSSLQRPVIPHASKLQQHVQTLKQQQQQQLDPLYHHPHHHSLATDLSLVMYAAAVLGQQPHAEWLAEWQHAVLQQLPNANVQDISQMLWSLASLGLFPDAAWLQQVLAAAEPLLPSAGSHSTSNMAWALSRFNQQLPEGWMEALLEAVQQDRQLASNPQALSSLLASLARLKAPVELSKLSSILDQSIEYLPNYTPWQLTNTVWAGASLTANPSAQWIKQFLSCTAQFADARNFSVNQLASILWSLAVLRRSGERLLASQQLQVQVLLNALAAANNASGLQTLGPAGRSGLAWALATLGVVPSRPWLAQYLSAAFNGGLASDKLRCANVLFCVASLDFEYLVEWLGEFLAGDGDHAAAAGGLDLSLEKYASLAAVLAALSEMDSKQLRAAWLDISNTEWSPEAAVGEGTMSSALHLPPALSTWVDYMLMASSTAKPVSAAGRQAAQEQF